MPWHYNSVSLQWDLSFHSILIMVFGNFYIGFMLDILLQLFFLPGGTVILTQFQESLHLCRLAGYILPVAGWQLVLVWGQILLFCLARWLSFLVQRILSLHSSLVGFSHACFVFSAALLLSFFRYSLQDLLKTSTWSDICSTHKELMMYTL